MVGGIRSRRLASKIAQLWQTEKEDGSMRAWVCSMNTTQWRDIFGASVTELRNLLEFSRDQAKGVAVDLIEHQSARLEVESYVDDFSESPAKLAPVDASALSSIGILIEDKLVGLVCSKDQADIQSLLSSSGLIISIKFSASSGKGYIELQLENPDDELPF